MNRGRELKSLISKYRVCWSSYPEQAVIDGTLRQVGFRVELYGTCLPEAPYSALGSVRCYEVWTALEQLAKSIMPCEAPELECEIGNFDNAIHYSRMRRNRGDVELHIRIIRTFGFETADECAINRLREITANLELLGSPQNYWRKMA